MASSSPRGTTISEDHRIDAWNASKWPSRVQAHGRNSSAASAIAASDQPATRVGLSRTRKARYASCARITAEVENEVYSPATVHAANSPQAAARRAGGARCSVIRIAHSRAAQDHSVHPPHSVYSRASWA